MRNLFDQYSQPENRLTHALTCCLEADRRLLDRFVRWTVAEDIRGRRITVLEQSLPGDPLELSEDEAERRGLPDACIHDGDSWALIIESKFASDVNPEQLRRHARTMKRRGLLHATLLVIAVGKPDQKASAAFKAITWSQVYRWLCRESAGSAWARSCAEYLEVAESRGAAQGYLTEGMLTVFSGIPFGPNEPYVYSNAKRLLRLLRGELVKDRRLANKLNANIRGEGRSAITGRGGSLVWDFIPLKSALGDAIFTQHPHLTFGIHADHVDALVTVPNGVRSRMRAKLLGDDFDSFQRVIEATARKLRLALQRAPGAVPIVNVLQRHYLSQRSSGTIDCQLKFDVRTALPRKSKQRGKVKSQPQWLQAVHSALASRRSNIQFQIGAVFPYAACNIAGRAEIAKVIADVWLACGPVLDRMHSRK